jgi:GNAT superfamily N-acetyltransferase
MEDLQVTRRPRSQDVSELRDALSEFNIRTTGYKQWQELAIFVRADDGGLEAGISALVWGGCCEVDLLWVAEDSRGQGLGRRLLQRIEDEARALGCRKLILTTYSFQAPAFYEKLGFRVAGRIDDHPRGHAYLLLEKGLDAPGA